MATNQIQASSISSSVYKDTKRLDSSQYTNLEQHYSIIKFSFNCDCNLCIEVFDISFII